MWHEDEQFWEVMSPFIFDEARRSEAPENVDQIIRLLGISPPQCVLDLCCGQGRHTFEFARRGFPVVGVDRTASYVQEARKRVADMSVQPEFVEQDMRQFSRPAAFDAVLNLYTSFGYFKDPADDRRVLSNIFISLNPGGRLLMDLISREILERNFLPSHQIEIEGGTWLRETAVNPDWTWVDSRWTLTLRSKRHEFTVSHRLYSGNELTELLKQSGFCSVRLFGDLSGSLYNENARRLVVLANKPSDD
jgi:SAM-dependent methyltransferase